MSEEIKKKILIIEDDMEECQAFARHIKTREDIELVGITNSSEDGIRYLKNYKIDAVILDIELQYGVGSGIEFIENLNREKVKYKPMIVVISAGIGENTYNFLHKNKVEHIFYKGQKDYSQERVVKLIVTLASYNKNDESKIIKITSGAINIESEYEAKVSSKINKMLDDFGILENLTARKYLFDAIYYLVCEADKVDISKRVAILSYISNRTGRPDGAIHKAISNAIKRSWNRLPPSEIEKMYTAALNYNTRNTYG